MTTSRTASGSSKMVQEFHLDVYQRCAPTPVTKGLQPPWERRQVYEDPNMYAVVTTVTPLGSPTPKAISIRVIKKNPGIDADEELDTIHLHDYPSEVKKGHPLPLSARTQNLSVLVRWKVLKTNPTEPDLYRRAQMNFLDSKALEACLALAKPLLSVKVLDPPAPSAAITESTSSVAPSSTSTSGVSVARATTSSSANPSSLARSQTAFQPSRAQVAAPSLSSLFGPLKSTSITSRKDSSKRKKLAQVDEDQEMADGDRPSSEAQADAPKKKKRSNPSPVKISGPARSIARPSSSTQSRPAVQSTNRSASVAPAALTSTNRKSSSSLSSSPGSSGSPTPAQIKKAARPPNPFKPREDRTPSTTNGHPAPALAPAFASRTPASSAQPDQPIQQSGSTPARSDLMAIASSPPSHSQRAPSQQQAHDSFYNDAHMSLAPDPAPQPGAALFQNPLHLSPSIFDGLAGLTFDAGLMDAPVSPLAAPPSSSRAVSSAAAAAGPAVGMLVTIEEATEGPENGGRASASGKAVDPRERGGDGVRVEMLVDGDEMELDDLDDDALRKVVDEVMSEAGFSDLVGRIERMMPISEE